MFKDLPDDLNNWSNDDFKNIFNIVNENKKQKCNLDIDKLHNFLENNNLEDLSELWKI
jgi:hypothetical protein